MPGNDGRPPLHLPRPLMQGMTAARRALQNFCQSPESRGIAASGKAEGPKSCRHLSSSSNIFHLRENGNGKPNKLTSEGPKSFRRPCSSNPFRSCSKNSMTMNTSWSSLPPTSTCTATSIVGSLRGNRCHLPLPPTQTAVLQIQVEPGLSRAYALGVPVCDSRCTASCSKPSRSYISCFHQESFSSHPSSGQQIAD